MEKEKMVKYLKWGIGLGVLSVSAGLALAALQSVVAVAATGLVALVAVNVAPPLANYLAVLRLRTMKKIAAENPVETEQLLYLEEQKRFAAAREHVITLAGVVKKYGNQVEEFRTRRPHLVAEYEKNYNGMCAALSLKTEKLQKFARVLEERNLQIAELSDNWDMACAAQEANRLLNSADNSDPISQLMSSVAQNSVKESMARAMAEMDVTIALDYASFQATPGMKTITPSDVLELKEIRQ